MTLGAAGMGTIRCGSEPFGPNPAGLAIVPEPGLATLRRPRAKESLDPIELERFERTLLPHMRAAYNLARWLTRSDHDAEDVVQEAYLRAFRFFGGFRGGDAKAWLLTIVRNTSHSTWRRLGEASTTVPLDEDTPEVEDGTLGPEDLLLQKASGEEGEEALDALPVEFREVVVLRELEGLSYKEMAQVTQLPIGTVMSAPGPRPGTPPSRSARATPRRTGMSCGDPARASSRRTSTASWRWCGASQVERHLLAHARSARPRFAASARCDPLWLNPPSTTKGRRGWRTRVRTELGKASEGLEGRRPRWLALAGPSRPRYL